MSSFQFSRFAVLLTTFITVIVIILITTSYFIFWYERVPVEDIALDFCACAELSDIKLSMPQMSREGFLYYKGQQDCFAGPFAQYAASLTYEERQEYVTIIMDKIFQICPNALENLYPQASLEENTDF